MNCSSYCRTLFSTYQWLKPQARYMLHVAKRMYNIMLKNPCKQASKTKYLYPQLLVIRNSKHDVEFLLVNRRSSKVAHLSLCKRRTNIEIVHLMLSCCLPYEMPCSECVGAFFHSQAFQRFVLLTAESAIQLRLILTSVRANSFSCSIICSDYRLALSTGGT